MAFSPMALKRHRYALFPDNRIKRFIDSEQAREKLAEQGANKMSIHSFSSPLERRPSPERVWGDLHYQFHMKFHHAHSLTDAAERIICDHKIPLSSVTVYSFGKTAEMIIKESCFRGEVGSPSRLNFDKISPFFYNQLKHHIVGKTKIPFSSIPIQQMMSPEKLETNKLRLFQGTELPTYDPHTLSLLAEKYYYITRNRSLHPDHDTPKWAYLKRCSVFNSLLNMKKASSRELRAVRSLIEISVDRFMSILELHGRPDLINGINANELAGRLNYDHPYCELNARQFANEIVVLGKCKGGCGVTSPKVLPFQKNTLTFDTNGQPHAKCIISESGLYLRPNGSFLPPKRIMEPIWVKDTSELDDNGMGFLTITCHDIDGFQKDINIPAVDIDSPRLFSTLQFHKIHVPSNKNDKGAIREYLSSQYTRSNRRKANGETRLITQQRGWQPEGKFFPPDISVTTSNSYEINNSKETDNPAILLAILTSWIAPLLKPLKHHGVCLHFYGGSKETKDALLFSACSAWNTFPHTLTKIQHHLKDIKNNYKDSSLCICNVSATQTKQMRGFLRRYFFGRKNAEKGICGTIISVGDAPLSQQSNKSKGLNAFTYEDKLLAIDVYVGDFKTGCNVPWNLVLELQEDLQGTLLSLSSYESEYTKRFTPIKKVKIHGKIQQLFSLLAATASIAMESGHLGFWKGKHPWKILNEIQSDTDSQWMNFESSLRGLFYSLPPKKPLVEGLPQSPFDIVNLGNNTFLYPARQIKTILADSQTPKEVINWLASNGVFKRKRNGKLCCSHYSKAEKKTVRCYIVNASRVRSLMAIFEAAEFSAEGL